MQQQNTIDDLITQMTQVQPPYSISDKMLKPLFPADNVLTQHLQPVEMSQNQDNNRPLQAIIQNHHMNQKERLVDPVTMESQQKQKYPLWWNSQPTGFITTQLSNMGWRVPHFEHFTKQGAPAKRLTREHYSKELYFH